MSERQTIRLNERGEEISDAPAAQKKKKNKVMVAWIIGGSMIFVVLLVVGLLIYAFHEPARKTVTVDPSKVDDGSGNGPGPQMSGLTPLVKFPVDADPGPKVVSAKLQNVLPQEAVHELAKQAGANLPEPSQGFWEKLTGKRINLTVEKQPFWDAAMQVCQESGMMLTTDWQKPGEIVLAQGQERMLKVPVIKSGSFRVGLQNLTRTITLEPGSGRPPYHNLVASLTILAEPSLKVFTVSSQATVETATDAAGNNLVVSNQNRWYNGGGSRSTWQTYVNAELKYPTGKAGARIKQLKGYVSAFVKKGDETVSVKSPMSAGQQVLKVDGNDFRFLSMRKNGGTNYDTRIQMDGSASASPVFGNYEARQKMVKLVDSEGKEFQNGGGGYGGGRTFDWYLNFSKGTQTKGEPAELQLIIPTGVREIRVPFEFDNLVMP